MLLRDYFVATLGSILSVVVFVFFSEKAVPMGTSHGPGYYVATPFMVAAITSTISIFAGIRSIWSTDRHRALIAFLVLPVSALVLGLIVYLSITYGCRWH